MDSHHIIARAGQLGMTSDEATGFAYELVCRYGETVSDVAFLFEAIKYVAQENKRLKEQIAWTKQDRSSSN